MPVTGAGWVLLVEALAAADEQPEHPDTVWRFDPALAQEVRGAAYAYRGDGEGRQVLVVSRVRDEAGRLIDDVRWAPAALVRARRE